MSVRDEDFTLPTRFRSVSYYGSGTADADVPDDAARRIAEMVACSPPGWTARLIWEDLREAGAVDISEGMVARVLEALR